MAVNQTLFVAIPAIAMLLNLFLLLICLSAKKNKLITAFMLQIGSFVLWTGGSLAMRSMVYPGAAFWFNISITGIFLVPFTVFNFVYHYTETKGNFTYTLIAVSWVALAVLANTDVFFTSPTVVSENGTRSFTYGVSYWTLIPLVLSLITIALSFQMVYQGIKYKGQSLNAFMPFFIGMIVLFSGLAASMMIPGADSFPIDPLAAGINAMLLFYSLYKKRLISFKMITSRGPLYLSASIIMTVIMTGLYSPFERTYDLHFPDFVAAKPIVFAVLLSLTTILVYILIKNLTYSLFNKSLATREEELRLFSREINESLNDQQIFKTFCNLIERATDCDMAYVLVRNDKNDFVTKAVTKSISTTGLTIRGESPVVAWLEEHNLSISYKDFTRTKNFRAMWESEKDLLESNYIKLLLPLSEGGKLLGFAMLADREGRKNYSAAEITFLESAGAVMSIAAKNAMMYAAMQREAYVDTLTGLYNRRYFTDHAKKQFEQARMNSYSIAMVSLDDFALFRELYGTQQIEKVICDLADILRSTLGDRGCLARYESREFALSLPFMDTQTASQLIDVARATFKTHIDHNRERGYPFFTFSAGICGYPVTASTFDETLKFAGIALYAAKKNGKNRTQIYRADTASITATPEAVKFDEQCARTIYALTAAIDVKDHYTYQHSQNVAAYASRLARAIGLDPEHVEIIRQAGLLHDIGKIGIPESILGKEGMLTDEEYAIMKQHPEASVAMIKYLPSLDYVVPTAFSHHERWDGKGYPRGLAGEDIPVGARCLCIADSFDAMTTSRSYKPAMKTKDALDEIRRNLGTQFDPKIGLAFIKMIEEESEPPAVG